MAGSTTSDLNGDFTLSAVPPGMQLLVIDSTTAQSAPDSSAYASFQEEITLIADVTNIIDRPIFLPRIDATSATVIDSTSPIALGAPFPLPSLGDAMEDVSLSVDRFCLLAGIEALAEMMAEDATAVCGARHRRHGDRFRQLQR